VAALVSACGNNMDKQNNRWKGCGFGCDVYKNCRIRILSTFTNKET